LDKKLFAGVKKYEQKNISDFSLAKIFFLFSTGQKNIFDIIF